MRPPLSVAGTRWTRCTPLSNFSLREHAGAVDRGDRFLVAADLGRARRDQLEPPALRLGEALVHAQQVAGEQRRLVAAGAGADLEHRGAVVGGVARQQLDRQRALGLGQLVADLLGLGRRHFLELGLGGRVGEHAVQHLELGAQPPHLARRGGDRLDRGIILGQPHELVGRQVAARHRLRQAHACAPRSTRSVPTKSGSLRDRRPRVSIERAPSTLLAGSRRSLSCASTALELIVADDRAHSSRPARIRPARVASSCCRDRPCPSRHPSRRRSAAMRCRLGLRLASPSGITATDGFSASGASIIIASRSIPPPSRPPACAARRAIRSARRSGRRRAPCPARRAGR